MYDDDGEDDESEEIKADENVSTDPMVALREAFQLGQTALQWFTHESNPTSSEVF